MVHLVRGLVAGAAGTTALNAVTYLDMVLRARPASTTPDETVRRTEELIGTSMPDGGTSGGADNRRSGVGALLGIATGLGSGLVHAVLRERFPGIPLPALALATAAVANAGSVAPMTALGVTDPRTWSASSWLSDLVPHLAFGVATAASYELCSRGRRHC
ncbi:hypothetical protein EIL87_11520 [Saccharopolyspora rhizosphaerae]|uniref:DUF1440 domain-containing protein n=1 Tax=Saccharopolyspora rhizosphaerae TaxID=2492662 RepID=A0A3R8QAX3_9PSEU|nr:hypothetical protein [Saccharopolyspora rhizosphaerae]RRO16912.1 hypothetical protein EIL87_11520 [Saccharopolyspora rhizosphaerae]